MRNCVAMMIHEMRFLSCRASTFLLIWLALTDNDVQPNVILVVELDVYHVIKMVEEETGEQELDESQQRLGFVDCNSAIRSGFLIPSNQEVHSFFHFSRIQYYGERSSPGDDGVKRKQNDGECSEIVHQLSEINVPRMKRQRPQPGVYCKLFSRRREKKKVMSNGLGVDGSTVSMPRV